MNRRLFWINARGTDCVHAVLSILMINRRNRCGPRMTGGFTLIEVLLALTIFAVAAAVVYASFSTTRSNLDSAEALRSETDLARTLLSRLSDDILNAYCSPRVEGSFFYGKKDEVQTSEGRRRTDALYLTTLTNTRRPGTKETELWEVGYFFKEKPEGGGRLLMRREKREPDSAVPPLEGGEEYSITDRVEGLQFRYFDGAKWIDEMGGPDRCVRPLAVEITLVLSGGRVYTTGIYR